MFNYHLTSQMKSFDVIFLRMPNGEYSFWVKNAIFRAGAMFSPTVLIHAYGISIQILKHGRAKHRTGPKYSTASLKYSTGYVNGVFWQC